MKKRITVYRNGNFNMQVLYESDAGSAKVASLLRQWIGVSLVSEFGQTIEVLLLRGEVGGAEGKTDVVPAFWSVHLSWD